MATGSIIGSAWPSFVLGVNYWPRRKGVLWWQEFSADEVRQDFELMSELGLAAVRIFLLWQDFQPERWKVEVKRLNELERVLDTAQDLGLKCAPVLFTGHVGGQTWLPSWQRDLAGQPRSLFEDEAMLEAQLLLANTLAGAFAKHPALLYWDIGNQLADIEVPRSEELAAAWAERLAGAIEAAFSGALVSCGLSAADLRADRNLNPLTLAQACDFLSMQARSTDALAPPFLNILTESLGGKPTLFAGLATSLEYDAAADFYQAALEHLWNAGSLGAFVWSFGDYDPALRMPDPAGGVVRLDGTLKPAAEALARFAAQPRPFRSLPPEKRFSGLDGYYRELPTSLTERFQEFRM